MAATAMAKPAGEKAEPFPILSRHDTDSSSSLDQESKENECPDEKVRPPSEKASDAVDTMSCSAPVKSSETATVPKKTRFMIQRKAAAAKGARQNPLLVYSTFIILTVLAGYAAAPGKSNIFYPALFVSYPLRPTPNDPEALLYGKGLRDIYFVLFYTTVMTFSREFIMQILLRPLAGWCGITKTRTKERFMEQVYSAIYFGLSSPFGLYVMSRTPVWYFSTPGMYLGFPHTELEGVFKAYYLLQASYWSQQALVLLLGLEKPRKDFRELVAHHIITLSLIGLSYRFHFTYMGLAVYITHDVSDFFLATSKTLNYLNSSFVDPYFVIFMASWVYLRHYINLKILFSFVPYLSIGPNPHPLADPRPEPYFSAEVPGLSDKVYMWPSQFSSIGSYEPDWGNQHYKCWLGQLVTFSLLGALQAVNLFWLFLICRVAYRFILNGEKKDDRSDSESEDGQGSD